MAIQRPIRIEPETLLISKGDCVIWFNRAESAEEVKVSFEGGKKGLSGTEAPTGFSLDEASCYATSWIPFAKTSSLRLMEKGTYVYVIEANAWGK
jgi:hypothetical protein